MSITEELKMKYICDVCDHVAWFRSSDTPHGWCTTREDHNNTICPDCNPYLTYSREPNLEKMKRIEKLTHES